jgi:polyhydroxyalkanoate synthesis regulator phasin
MHIRKQIIENQKKFRKEIVDSLKLEFKEAKKELAEIKTEDKTIKEEKQKLENKFNKIKISQEIEKLFITEKNLYPNYYAWWDETNKQVSKLKYKDK